VPISPIRIILADDHVAFRTVLRTMLNKERDCLVIHEVSDGIELLDSMHESTLNIAPRIIVMDVQMPRMNGIEATRRLIAVEPHARLLALSMHDDEPFVLEMIAAGASGYMLKSDPWPTLLNAIRDVAAGRFCLSPSLSHLNQTRFL
jgi:DNA-binding NarL/FixJ family response regulator